MRVFLDSIYFEATFLGCFGIPCYSSFLTCSRLSNFFLVSVFKKHSSDTSESENEPSSHSSRRLGVASRGALSSNRVFGLTEVSLQRRNDGNAGEVRN